MGGFFFLVSLVFMKFSCRVSLLGIYFCGLYSVVDSFHFVEQVIFVPPAPLHPHIYSNGHICLGLYLF